MRSLGQVDSVVFGKKNSPAITRRPTSSFSRKIKQKRCQIEISRSWRLETVLSWWKRWKLPCLIHCIQNPAHFIQFQTILGCNQERETKQSLSVARFFFVSSFGIVFFFLFYPTPKVNKCHVILLWLFWLPGREGEGRDAAAIHNTDMADRGGKLLGTGVKPVPMKLFATWEVEKSSPNCIPRYVAWFGGRLKARVAQIKRSELTSCSCQNHLLKTPMVFVELHLCQVQELNWLISAT